MKTMQISKGALFCAAIVLIAIGSAAIFFLRPFDDKTKGGGKPFELTKQELPILEVESKKGNCVAAYKVAQHHLYASLDLQQAEKYYRLAAKCPNAAALAGLITVLRKPEHDAEIDALLISLRKLDPEMGKAASEEIELRRAERGTK